MIPKKAINVRATSIATGSFQPSVRTTSILNALVNVEEVPPSVIRVIGDMAIDTVNLDSNNLVSRSDVTQAIISLMPATPIKLSDISAGDVIFVVATPESVHAYRDTVIAQKFQVNNYCHHQKELPVLLENVIHCDVAIGDGKIARIVGPHGSEAWAAFGSKSKSVIVPVEALKNPTKKYVVLRPKNEKVARRMAETAEKVISRPVSYNLSGWFANALLHDRGDQDSLTDDEAPPKNSLDIPNSMYCSEFAANIIMDGERENRKNERESRKNDGRVVTQASIRRTKISPAELIDKLAGSGNYEIFSLKKPTLWETIKLKKDNV